jgi:opacity protein-like surface antigen
MGMLRAVAIAFLATWGAALASADGGPAPGRRGPDRYAPYEPPPAPGFFDFNWTGFYVGTHLGAAFTNAESTETIFPNNPNLFQSLNFDQSEKSVIGGVHAGWQMHWGKLVAGAEIGFSFHQFDTTRLSPLFLEFVRVVNLQRSVELGDIFTLTGRVGYADGRWLAYFKGGLATAEVDARYLETATGGRASSSGLEVGWTAGGGIEYALTQNWFLGFEYNIIHFRADIKPPPIPLFPTQTGDVDIDTQSLVVRLNYRFGPCCLGPPPGDDRP